MPTQAKTFTMKNKILSALFILLMSHIAMANMDCSLTSKDMGQTQFTHHWYFGEMQLVCDPQLNQSFTSQTQAFNELLIIRGNVMEILDTDFEVLHHAAGYSLVRKLQPNTNQTDSHLTFIPLSQFKSIKPFKASNKSGNANVQQLVNQVNANRWLQAIVTLSSWSRRTGEAGNVSAANWIAAQFNAMSFQVSQPSFQVGQSTTSNIMGTQTGLIRPDDWYIVGGHMDAVPTGNAPGAVDNASGCAAVIEMARIASQYTFEATLIFMCYSGEEQGLYGSEFHANTLTNEGNNSKVKAALTLDMVGYTSNNDHELLIESAATYQSLMNDMAQNAATYAPGLTVLTSTNYFGSDHVSYIDNVISMPAVLSIDVDYGIYPDYHRSTDLPENINTTQGELIIKTNLATLVDKAVLLGLSDLIFAHGFQ
jgi:hypothetical protein